MIDGQKVERIKLMTYMATIEDAFNASMEKLDEFIESEGLHINSEEPKVIVDDKGCYRVNVSYTIEN